MMKKTHLLIPALLAAFSLGAAEPAFHYAAENTGAVLDGKPLPAAVSRGLRFVPGLAGKAVELTPAARSQLRFDVPDSLLGESGTISFWVCPNWDGDRKEFHNYFAFSTLNSKGEERLPLFFWNWIRFDLMTDDNQKVSVEARAVRESIVRGGWMHVAVIWNRRNWCAFYINGQPYGMQRIPGTAVRDIVQLFLGANPRGTDSFNGAVDELKIYRKALSDREITEEYRRFAVFDFYHDRALYDSGKPVELELTLAPVGHFNRSSDGEAAGRLFLRLLSQDDKVLEEKDFGEVKTSGLTKISMPIEALSPGIYRLEAVASTANKSITRTFRVTAAGPGKPENAAAGELKLGKPFFEFDFLSATIARGTPTPRQGYLEAGSQKSDCIGCVIPIPEQYRDGRNLVLELQWPDDRERMFGIFLYPEKGSKSEIRDRLGGGIAAGGEYPNSGELKTARYFFHASSPSYLLELRTMATGVPAAAAKLRIYPVEGPLPRLAVNPPAGFAGRRIGHLDEDQSFDYNFDWDRTRPALERWQVGPKILRMLREYYAYTGQNLFALPLIRYNYAAYQTGSTPDWHGMVPFENGEIPYWVETLAKDDTSFRAIVNVTEPVQISQAVQRNFEFGQNGVFSYNNAGSIVDNNRCNPAHPMVRALFVRNFEDFMIRFGKLKGLGGIQLWTSWQVINFSSLESGYDDYTVQAFAKETGVAVPNYPAQKYRKRYEFLTSPPNRARWVQWRADQFTAAVREIRAAMDRHNQDLPLYIAVTGTPLGNGKSTPASVPDPIQMLKEERGVDIPALSGIAGVYVVPMRDSLKQLWQQHWNDGVNNSSEMLHDFAMMRPFYRKDHNYVNDYRIYFEMFMNSPDPATHSSYFQNAEMKPHGRFALKEPAYMVAASDAQEIAAGAQPLFSLGREDEIREFVQAFRALPSKSFLDVAGAVDPVTVRYLPTPDGTYLYAVNLLHSINTVHLKIADAGKWIDLSGGSIDRDGVIVLKPFQLRSFLIPGNVVPELEKVEVPAETVSVYDREIAQLEGLLDMLIREKMDSPALTAAVKNARQAYAKGRYAEVHRLLNSKPVKDLAFKLEAFKLGYLPQQKEMLSRSHIAINCGSMRYFKSESGKLFFPDEKFVEGGSYGNSGRYETVTRNAADMPESDLRPLFADEAYNIDGYRFRVKPGNYTVRLYLRVGYPPGRAAGKFLFNLDVNGNPAVKDYDVFTHENPETGYAVLEIPNVKVTSDGDLILTFLQSGNIDPTARLANGIEIVPSAGE